MNVDPQRLRAELEKMRQLIASDPKILAQFDTDGNGVIDGDEWEAVRNLVVQRLEREHMEAELARLYADLEDDDAAPVSGVSDDGFLPPPQRDVGLDFSGAELAFDPRAQRQREAEERSVSQQVFEREVARRYNDAWRAPTSASRGGIGDHRALVLERVGGLKRVFGNMFKREFLIRDPQGESVGKIQQRENEMFQNMMDYDLFRDPDVTFFVRDDLADAQYTFTRSTGLAENTIQVSNPSGRYFAYTTWTMSFVRRKYEVRVEREGVSYYVRRRLLKPWSFDILDPFEEPIGFMEAQWMGIGFLVGASRTYLEVEKEVSNDAMWGFLATALLAQIDSEQGSRKAGFDLFND